MKMNGIFPTSTPPMLPLFLGGNLLWYNDDAYYYFL